MKYTYLAASLPTLSMDTMPPLTEEAFLDQCDGVMSEDDFAEMNHILREQEDQCESSFAKRWCVFEFSLRHHIAEVRAGRLGLDPRTAVPYHDAREALVKKSVVDAFAKSNPLEREWTLDNTRWYVLNELAREDPFGLNAILAYALKLRLAHRWAGMNGEKGTTYLNQYLQTILDAQPVEAT